ncbi:hypothetical protein [Chryseobacterium sp. 18068]|uniref:hypothetical protein n=1 Tax=Chryseobacterium sp. 18068 TaxID=2681414 RepID=UPI00135C558A|nr:hypothetical protein [Chryseobacterium sp. 18068]
MNIYQQFSQRLDELQPLKVISIYFRGINAKDAFGIFKQEPQESNIRSFAEKIFFFGAKSEHYWKNDVQNKIPINEVGEKVFEYLFTKYRKLKNSKDPEIKAFIEKNPDNFEMFFDVKRKKEFINLCMNQSLEDIKKTKNYLFMILHRIGNFTSYKKKSHFVSSTSKLDISKKFSEDGIIIKFWDPHNLGQGYKGVVSFNEIIHSGQKEYSVFSAIFPHYIFSFTYKSIEYFNPYIESCVDVDTCILEGFPINQENFMKRLYEETHYEAAVETENHKDYKEIGKK